MESLKKIMPPEVYAKFARLSMMDDSYMPMLFLLELCAFTLCIVRASVEGVPLEEVSDLARFSFDGLDKAFLEIGEALEESWPQDPRGRLLAYIEANDYRIGGDYRKRRARIVERGRYNLLIRISQRIAGERIA